MELDFIKASPSQNTTVFVTSFCPRDAYTEVAEKIMSYEYLQAEQVGFLVAPKNKNSIIGLDMAGGEFCGNAALSVAAYILYRDLCKNEEFFIEVSGESLPIKCFVKKKSHNIYYSKVEIPPAVSSEDISFKINDTLMVGSLVELKGIAHIVLDYWPSNDVFEQIIKKVEAMEIVTDAIGIIPYKKIDDKIFEIKPYVYVKGIDRGVFERGCGSGSLALGIYLAREKGVTGEIVVQQPGGTITVEIGAENYISTEVKFTCEGKIML